jgi:uncharacterized cupredoxin-like copper-binding protein/Cu/Ag efflux protein CusF
MMKIIRFAIPLACAIFIAGGAAAHVGHQHGTGDPKRPTPTVTPEQKEWGIAAMPNQTGRRIDIRMGDDMRFQPSHIDIRVGETVQFVIENRGSLLHEMVIGTRSELDAHAALMLKHPNMDHDEPWMAHVDPGKTGEISWTFNRTGEFEFACLIPGHFQSGMRGTIKVVAAGPGSPLDASASQPSRDHSVRSRPGTLAQHGASHGGHASSHSDGHAKNPAAAAADEWVDAEVRRIDSAQSRLTLRHGEIRSLDMPPMTMVFHVNDAKLLDGLAPGDRVRFRTIHENGRYIATAIEKR